MDFVGRKGTYRVNDAQPFAYGRVSVLYRATDQARNDLCLKVFPRLDRRHGRFTAREFFREFSAQTDLRHRNILPIEDFGSGGRANTWPLFIALPYCEGGDLRSVLAGRSFIPFNEAISILDCIAEAIDFAHVSGFIHGDIKPENILFRTQNDGPCLADFGLSKYFQTHASPVSRNASTQPTEGTPAYLSPEQIDIGEQYPASDIYSFSLVAFEMLTGRLPFDTGRTQYQQMRAKVEGNLLLPQDANPRLTKNAAHALISGLSRDRSKRPTSARELCDSLRARQSPHRSGEGPAVTVSKAAKVPRDSVFVSYSHHDRRWLRSVQTHLRVPQIGRKFDLWDDTRIRPGERWMRQIEEALTRSKVAILIVSAQFLASEFVASNELPRILARESANGLIVVPLLASPSRYVDLPELSKIQPLNKPSRTLIEMSRSEREKTMVELARTVERCFPPLGPIETPHVRRAYRRGDDAAESRALLDAVASLGSISKAAEEIGISRARAYRILSRDPTTLIRKPPRGA